MTSPSLRYVDAHQLKTWIHDEAELALLDVREHGQYGENHLFFAVPLPYSVLELNILRLVPRKAARVVLYGDQQTERAVQAAARVLAGMGYGDVHILRGGMEAWKAAGYATFAGVNLPSKTFGELAEHAYGTPSVSATRLNEMLSDDREQVMVLDGRPIAEYRKMSIPGAVCCPNGELALRVQELVPDPETTIVVNCAGRTRSIIGAQTLIHLGIPNKVYALENGTQGWYLQDFPLEHGAERIYPEQISEASRDSLRECAARVTERFGLASVDAEQVHAWLNEDSRTVFLCDVRTEEEFRSSDWPGIVQHAPGGQLIQATDQYVGVRKARVVLCDMDGIRAPMVASWLKQLGWEVYLLADAQHLSDALAVPVHRPALERTTEIPAVKLAEFVAAHPDVHILDARSSMAYRALCLKDSAWTIRPVLLEQLGEVRDRPVLLLGASLAGLQVLAGDLEQAGVARVYVCVVDAQGLRDSGLPVMTGKDVLPDAACIDYLFFVHDRHDGNKEAARRYLEWETNLISQIDEQERNTFSIDF